MNRIADDRTLREIFNAVLAGSNRDAFGRLRVSMPQNLFDSKQLVDNAPLVFDDQAVSGSGTSSTYVSAKVCSTIAVSNLTAGLRVRQSFEKFPYQPGKSHLVMVTFKFGAATTGITRQVGYFDGTNGVYLRQNSSGLAFCKAYGGTVQAAAQSEWNIDKLDGKGLSRLTLNPANAQILFIDFEWLGVGIVRFGFVINGIFVTCHESYHSNIQTTVYTANPNLPIRYSIQNDGTGPAADMDCICSCVMSEGGSQDTGWIRNADTGTAGFVSNNDANLYPLLAIRLKSTHVSNTSIFLTDINITCVNNIYYRWVVLLNPTIAGTALTFGTSLANSGIEVALPTNATTVSAEGTRFASGYGGSSATGGSSQVSLRGATPVRFGASIAGVSDIIVLAAQRVSGSTSATYFASVNWSEST